MLIEQVGKRSQKSKHYFDTVTNLSQAVFTIHDQHYKDENNAWQEVDESIVNDTGGFDKKCDKTRHIFRIASGGNRRWYPRRNVLTEYVDITGMQYWDGNQWRNLNLPAAVWKSNGAEWDMTNMYASITNTWRRIKTNFILKNSNAFTGLRFQISFTGLSYNDTTGELTSTNDGVVVGYITKPVAEDANKANVPVTQTYASGYIEWAVDTTGATFPIAVDPIFVDGYGGDTETSKDTYLLKTSSLTNYGGQSYLSVRGNGTAATETALLEFTLTSLVGKTITEGTLVLCNGGSGNINTVYVSRILPYNSWLEASVCWDKRNTTDWWAGDSESNGGDDAGCTVDTIDYSGTDFGTFSTSSTDEDGYQYSVGLYLSELNFMISENYGIVLHTDSTTDSVSLYASDASQTGYRPYLSVTYADSDRNIAITETTSRINGVKII